MQSSFARLILSGAIALCLVDTASAQDDPPSPIRAFDVSTVERLGQEMFAQDQLAWLATDALILEHSQAELLDAGLAGWVTARTDDVDIVRFVRMGAERPEALYDIVFNADGVPSVSQPAEPTLSESEIAQYQARRLAIADIDVLCADNYNTIALADPESDGWLIWAMSATNDPGILPAGGHVRFTISADGDEILARDALSFGCMNIERRSAAGGPDDAVSSFVTHVVSLTPVESHVFLSLAESIPLYVGTLDGNGWRVEGGRISRVDVDSEGLDGYTARSFHAMYEECSAMVATDEEPPRYQVIAQNELKIIEATETETRFSLDDLPLAPVGVICSRLDIVPAPNDFKVTQAGLTLYIADRGEGHEPRSGVLERRDGEYTFTIVDGAPLTPELDVRIAARLASFPKD